MNTDVPDYDDVKLALNYDDDETVANALFAFNIEDSYYILRVTEAVRKLLERGELTPRQIVSIGRALHGLGRLPLRTPGLDIHISLFYKMGEGYQSYDMYISESRFATESGGYDNFGGLGTDSFSGITFSVGIGYREYDGFLIETENWPDHFTEMLNNSLEIHDGSDDSRLDWNHPDGDVFWEWIENHD
jgi:hypothetical protein